MHELHEKASLGHKRRRSVGKKPGTSRIPGDKPLRTSTARRVPQIGLYRISFVRAFNEMSRKVALRSLGVENKNLVP